MQITLYLRKKRKEKGKKKRMTDKKFCPFTNLHPRQNRSPVLCVYASLPKIPKLKKKREEKKKEKNASETSVNKMSENNDFDNRRPCICIFMYRDKERKRSIGIPRAILIHAKPKK